MCGCAQRAQVWPLFSPYLNFLCDLLYPYSSQCHLYADDLKIYVSSPKKKKSLRAGLIYPPGYLTSLLVRLTDISKDTCENGIFHFPPKPVPFPEYSISIHDATDSAVVPASCPQLVNRFCYICCFHLFCQQAQQSWLFEVVTQNTDSANTKPLLPGGIQG